LPTPKPQKAQPTVQMLETLMLRLTTKVTSSPASSTRSSSAAWRMSSITSGRLSANIASSSDGVSACPSRARWIESDVVAAVRRRGMNERYFDSITSSTRGAIQSDVMYCG
jgi:hypothetical protein